MSAVTSVLELAAKREPGPSPSFTPAHVLLVFKTVGEGGQLGREAIARAADLGDGAVRTVLGRLKDAGYFKVNASGCSLTETGRRAFADLARMISPIVQLGRTPLTVGGTQAAVAVRSASGRVRGGIEQRDAAIKVGASGATSYVMVERKFTIPGGPQDCEREFPSEAWKALRQQLRPRDGDAVLVCGADDQKKCTVGVLAAALTLIESGRS